MNLKKGENITLKIEKLAFGGAGIGYADNDEKFVVFVEGVVPGDEVVAQLKKVKPKYAEARKIEILKPSPLRIQPKCQHFGKCGGCAFQCLTYEKQLEEKQSQVKEALEHIGGFSDPPILEIKPCENPYYYRNKMEFSFALSDDGETEVGLHPKHYRYEVFQLNECFLFNKDIGGITDAVQKFAKKFNLKPYNFRSNEGLLRTLVVREGKKTGERMVNLVTSGEKFTHVNEFVKLLTEDAGKNGFKPVTSVYHTNHISKKGHRTEFKETLLFGKSSLKETMELETGAELHFEILPQSFFQPNTIQAEVLYGTVLELGNINKGDRVFDLFCGTGTIGLFCAHKAGHIFGVDLNKSAIENAKKNAQLNNIKNIEFAVGDAFEVISQRDDRPDKIIVDPPRAGLGPKLCEHLIELGAEHIVYVSCNPATLARDLEQLCKHRYKLQHVQPVDMFPHTYHIETVCELSLR